MRNDLFLDALSVSVFFAIMLLVNLLLAAAPLVLYLLKNISYNTFYFILNSTLSLSFMLTVLLYLKLYRKVALRRIPQVLGLSRSSISLRLIVVGALLFFVVIALSEITTVYNSVSGARISSNVGIVFGSAPIWAYLFSSFIAPIDEEVLFRAFLVPRLGVFISAAIFAVAHYGYNSIIEVVAAFIFGIIAGYIFRNSKSLYPSIIAHVLVNATTLLLPLLL